MYCTICNDRACYIITDKYQLVKYTVCKSHVDDIINTKFGLRQTIMIMECNI